MGRYLVSRLATMLITLAVVTAVVYLVISLTPGDPVAFMLGPAASQQQVVQIRHLLGLDQPPWQRYLWWLWRAGHGDLGVSLRSGAPVLPTLLARFPATVELMAGAMIVALVIGIPVGVLSAA